MATVARDGITGSARKRSPSARAHQPASTTQGDGRGIRLTKREGGGEREAGAKGVLPLDQLYRGHSVMDRPTRERARAQDRAREMKDFEKVNERGE